MRKCVPFIVACLGVISASGADAGEVKLDQLITEVKKALFQVQQDLHEQQLPQLQSVTLTLATDVKKTISGGFDVWILDFSEKYERDSSAEVTLTLKPPSPGAVGQVGQDDVITPLKTAIETTMLAYKKAKDSGPPALVLDSLKATLKFGVTNDTGGGLKFTIVPVTISGTGDYNGSATQQIDVTYGTASH